MPQSKEQRAVNRLNKSISALRGEYCITSTNNLVNYGTLDQLEVQDIDVLLAHLKKLKKLKTKQNELKQKGYLCVIAEPQKEKKVVQTEDDVIAEPQKEKKVVQKEKKVVQKEDVKLFQIPKKNKKENKSENKLKKKKENDVIAEPQKEKKVVQTEKKCNEQIEKEEALYRQLKDRDPLDDYEIGIYLEYHEIGGLPLSNSDKDTMREMMRAGIRRF